MKQLNNLFSAFSIKPLMLLFFFILLPTFANAQCPDDNHPHMIDLGLPSGTKWACCNVGASNPEDYGGYFAWGETTEKSSYTEENYLDGKGINYDIGKDIAGTQYDSATVNWGSPWVMPSLEQMNELKNSCTSEWTTENGVNGRRFTSANGASIFLPAAGIRSSDELVSAGSYGGYWSSSLYESNTERACFLLDFGNVSMYSVYTNDRNRDCGQSVRPVVASSSTPSGIAIDETNFPDENFRNWVLSQDYGQDGMLTEAEIAGVTEIDVSRKNISSLKGIEYFTALTGLYCNGNQLTSLDMSENTLLKCLICDYNSLTSLNVTKCTALVNLDCESNQLTALDITNNTALTDLTCGENLLTSLDVSNNIYLKDFDCSNNKITALNVSNNKVLSDFVCYKNMINGTAMDALIESLPIVNSDFVPISPFDSDEQNVITKTQVAAAQLKGWKTWYIDERGKWQEYEGSDPEIAPVDQGETISIGNEIDASTDLDGNVVGDVFYSISSGDGSYDPAEGCIVVTKPTDDAAIDGKDIFGEDFKAGYTGIVFKVAPGAGTVKVEAQTQGNMVLKVKIGNGQPVTMELEGKLKVSFPYNVSEETLVYIYGGTNAAGAKGMMKAASTDMLKIYGIEVTSSTDGIKAIDNEQLTIGNSPVYKLNGQRVEKPGKGIYIQNERKVLVK